MLGLEALKKLTFSSSTCFASSDMEKNMISEVASSIAALTGVYSAYRLRDRDRDKIKVSMGIMIPDTDPMDFLHLVNLREHKTIVTDFGTINDDGSLTSLLLGLNALMRGESEIIERGSRTMMGKSDFYEIGATAFRDSHFKNGIYAFTATQTYPTICWNSNKALRDRLQVRVKTYMKFWRKFLHGESIYS